MELTNALVRDRIADLNRLADELRVERTVHDAADRRSTGASFRPRSARLIGARLVALGTALGGRDIEAAGPIGR